MWLLLAQSRFDRHFWAKADAAINTTNMREEQLALKYQCRLFQKPVISAAACGLKVDGGRSIGRYPHLHLLTTAACVCVCVSLFLLGLR